ncbi:hypothetical protein NIBR502772_11000 [Pseudarthrobacter sp. NIBRBAC000502772]|uniref:hypothetical protein n=1 Tax=Pseudarthrobacter sp. NIBRBAC000502772 TaxID=2590775 RepID=UPI001132078C|nr:hypothetical protein [Pseudarthrobacter sp. NIBRBAC000502772]QDG66662.1 hypothetical protein NIBR502772_11000 [Pseudarthrobacter sp. NIBRBAC000502772]
MAAGNQRAAEPNEPGGTAPPKRAGIPVRVVFADHRYTIADFTDLMQNLEALLTIGMAQPYELTRSTTRANLADSVIIESIRKESPLEILMDMQASVTAVTSFITLAGGLIALRPLYATQQLKAAKADAEREQQKLKKKIARDLLSQYDDLSKKKKKKLFSDKKFRALIEQAAAAALSIESIESIEKVSSEPVPAPSFEQAAPAAARPPR